MIKNEIIHFDDALLYYGAKVAPFMVIFVSKLISKQANSPYGCLYLPRRFDDRDQEKSAYSSRSDAVIGGSISGVEGDQNRR